MVAFVVSVGSSPTNPPLSAILAPYLQTQAEISAGVTPVNYGYLPLDPRRYGLTTSDAAGTVNYTAITAATNVAVAQGGGIIPGPVGTYIFSASIPLVAGVLHQGAGIVATQYQSNGNYPVFTLGGSATVTINGGGVTQMTVYGSWSSSSPSANTGAHGISCTGANGTLFKDLRIEACDVGFLGAFNYEARMTRVKAIAGPGVNSQQCNIGIVMDVCTSANVNNAIYFDHVEMTFCWGNGWSMRNANGSTMTTCSAEACGQSGTGYGFVFGLSTALAVPCRFVQLSNNIGDSNNNGNWLFQASSLSRTSGLYDIYCVNNWSGQTGGDGVDYVNALDCSWIGGNSDTASACGMQLTNSPITVVAFTVRNFNVGAAGSAGVNLVNTQGAKIFLCDCQTLNLTGPPVGVAENGTSNYNNIQMNTSLQTDTQTPLGMLIQGANTICRNNRGFVTENSGVAAVSNGQTTIVVTHGLGITPTAGEIALTPTGAFYAYLSGSITSTQFTIGVSVSTGVSVGWNVALTRH